MRKREADIRVEENEMPRMVVRYLGERTLSKFVDIFGSGFRVRWELGKGNKIFTKNGWQLLVDGIYIIQYKDGSFETLSEDEFNECLGQYTVWTFNEYGKAVTALNDNGLHVFGSGHLTASEKEEFVEIMNSIPKVATSDFVNTNHAETITGPAAWLDTKSEKLQQLYLGKEEEKKVHNDRYYVSFFGNDQEGYKIMNGKTGKLVGTVYCEETAKRIVASLNHKSDDVEVKVIEKEEERSSYTFSVTESFWRSLHDYGKILFLNEKLLEGVSTHIPVGVQLLLLRPEKEVYLMATKLEDIRIKVVAKLHPGVHEYVITATTLNANDPVFENEHEEESIVETINKSPDNVRIDSNNLTMSLDGGLTLRGGQIKTDTILASALPTQPEKSLAADSLNLGTLVIPEMLWDGMGSNGQTTFINEALYGPKPQKQGLYLLFKSANKEIYNISDYMTGTKTLVTVTVLPDTKQRKIEFKDIANAFVFEDEVKRLVSDGGNGLPHLKSVVVSSEFFKGLNNSGLVKFISEVAFGVQNMSGLYVDKIFGDDKKESYKVTFYQDVAGFYEMKVSKDEVVNEYTLEFFDVASKGYFVNEINEGRDVAAGNSMITRLANAESKITLTSPTIVNRVCKEEYASTVKQTTDSIDLRVEKRPTISHMFTDQLTAESPQMNCLASLMHEIVHKLIKLGYGRTKEDFDFLEVPDWKANDMTFKLKNKSNSFMVKSRMSATLKEVIYHLNYYEVKA